MLILRHSIGRRARTNRNAPKLSCARERCQSLDTIGTPGELPSEPRRMGRATQRLHDAGGGLGSILGLVVSCQAVAKLTYTIVNDI